MGLFSFIKNIGVKVFGIGKTDDETVAKKLTLKEGAARKLEENISNLQLQVKGLGCNQNTTNEKVILLFIGNSNGIASVKHEEPVAQFNTVASGDNTLGEIKKKSYRNVMIYPVFF